MAQPTKRARENVAPGNIHEGQLSARDRPKAKRQAVGVTLSGGVSQPPRVIGYRRTGAHVDLTVKVESRSFQAHSTVLSSTCDFFGRKLASHRNGLTIELPTPSAAAFEVQREHLTHPHTPTRYTLLSRRRYSTATLLTHACARHVRHCS